MRHHRYSFQDYLAVEAVSTVKHEFLDGEIYAMAARLGPACRSVGGDRGGAARPARPLEAVVYVWQDRPQIEVRERAGDSWTTTTVAAGGVEVIESISCRLEVDSIHGGAGSDRRL